MGPAPPWPQAAEAAAPAPGGRPLLGRPAGRARRTSLLLSAGGAAGALLAALAWGLWTVAHGFSITNDSVAYAALARGFDAGRPFSSNLYWLTDQPGRLEAIWPPLYPALVAVVHALGPGLARSEWVVDGAAFAAAVGLGLEALRAASGRLPWPAVVICAVWPAGIAVAAHGWSEPVLLLALAVHYWLAARAARAAEARRPYVWLLFAQGAAAGAGFLARYAVLPFLCTAVLWGPALLWAAPRRGPRPTAQALLRAALPSLAGAALPALPWALAAWLATGRVGAPYVKAGDGLFGAAHIAAHVLLAEGFGLYVLPGGGGGGHAAIIAAVALGLVTLCGTLAALRWERRRQGGTALAAPAPRTLALLLGLLCCDAALYTAFLVIVRARYFFDQIDVRLMIPALFPLLLAIVGFAGLMPGRLSRLAWLGPLLACAVWVGCRTAQTAARHPELGTSLHPRSCTPGAAGDCGLLAWLRRNANPSTLVISNAGFPISAATGLPVEVLTAYPYSPLYTAGDVAAWTARWESLHPHGEVLLALDGTAGWLAHAAADYGPYVAAAWAGRASDASLGLLARPLVTGTAYRVWRLTAGPPEPEVAA